MKEDEKEIEQYFADAIMERPYGFSVDDRHFFLYPVTFGKMYLLQRYMEQLAIDAQSLQADVSMEALRLAKGKRSECLDIICCHTCNTKEELFDTATLSEKKAVLDNGLSDEDIAALMIIVLTSDKTDLFIRHYGIDKEHEDMRKVMVVKEQSDKNNYTFGGLTLYGSFIHPLLELGLTWDEIVWKRSYTNLRMLLADKVNTIYVTDEERKKIHISRDRNRVNGDDREALLRAIRSETWE